MGEDFLSHNDFELTAVLRLAGQVDTQTLEDILIYLGENDRGVDIAAPQRT